MRHKPSNQECCKSWRRVASYLDDGMEYQAIIEARTLCAGRSGKAIMECSMAYAVLARLEEPMARRGLLKQKP